MGEYLCNPLDEDLLDVEFTTGGFFSDDKLGVVESSETERLSPDVPASKGVRPMLSTLDGYYEFSCHGNVCY